MHANVGLVIQVVVSGPSTCLDTMSGFLGSELRVSEKLAHVFDQRNPRDPRIPLFHEKQ
jgi:hypothetical protein